MRSPVTADRRRLIAAYPHLTDRQRQAITLYELEGLTGPTLGARMGISANTALNVAKRARELLATAGDVDLFERYPQPRQLGPVSPMFGSKFKHALRYPVPMYGDIVEPFAGMAGYSIRWYARRVTLLDVRESVCAVWQYLTRASAVEVRALPLIRPGQDVHELKVCEEARALIRYWLNPGSIGQNNTLSGWAQANPAAGWGEMVRERLASSVDSIRHWRIIHGDYTRAPDTEATWFVDPPYEEENWYHTGTIMYGQLADWCRRRRGQTIVCEQSGAAWLPFEPLHGDGVVWTQTTPRVPVIEPPADVRLSPQQVVLRGLLVRQRQAPHASGVDWRWAPGRVRRDVVAQGLVDECGRLARLTASGLRAAEKVAHV